MELPGPVSGGLATKAKTFIAGGDVEHFCSRLQQANQRGGRGLTPIARVLFSLLAAWTSLACAEEPVAPEPAGKLVNVNEYVVRGNTVLHARDIEEAVYPFMGPQRSLTDIEGARDALQKRYQDKGYQSVFVELPEQQVEEGIVYLQVTETTLGRVRVVGAKHYSPKAVLKEVPALEEGAVPDFAEVQEQLSAANRNPGRQVVPVVREGQRPGTMDVDLQVDDKNPWVMSLGLNNDYSADTERLRSVVTLGHNNLWQRGHSASLTYFTAPQDRDNAEVWSGSYTAPLSERWSVQLSGYQSDSSVATIGGTNVLGNGSSYGAALIYTIPAQGNWANSLSVGLDFKNFDEEMQLGGDSEVVPIKYAPVTLSYNGYRYTERSQFGLGLSLVVGTRNIFGYTSDDWEFRAKRSESNPSFTVFKADSQFTLSFAGDWQAASKFSLQIASGPMISNEQVAAGGATSVRGYLAAERTGDDGYLFSQELRTPSLNRYLGKRLGGYVEDWRIHAFAEGGQLYLQDALPDQEDDFTLVSVGLGTRVQLRDWLSGSLDWAVPLKDGPNTDKQDSRVHFSVQANF